MRIHRLLVPVTLGLCASAATARAQVPSTPPSRIHVKQAAAPSSFVPPPSYLASAGEDDCANASLSSIMGAGTFPVNTTTATDSPQIGTGCVQPHRDVWFQWTATYTGMIEMNLCTGTTTDSVIAVWSGTACPSGTPLACNDDSCGLQSRVTFPITNGSVYLIQIGVFGTSLGFAGTFDLVAQLPPPPPTAANMNVDIGSPSSGFGVPSNAYGAGAGMPGFWNARSVTVASTQLNDLNNVPCGAVLTRTGTSLADFAFDNVATTGDDQALLDDAQDAGGVGGTTTWTFSNLFGGSYQVYTYAWAPDDATFRSSVSVAGSPDPSQLVGGTWAGAHAQGLTYARHSVSGIANGGSIAITVATNSGFATLNGFQIVRQGTTFTPYCFGDGTGTACPCGNNGAAGNGCANSVVAAGGNLTASGFASVSADSVVLTGTGMPNSSCLYFQGTTQIATAFGDGIRCVGGTVVRLGTKANSGGGSQYPAMGDPSVSVRGLLPMAGGTREYQCWYRNAAAFCTVSTFNLTNGVEIPWQP